jgi:hypothetical protein
MSAEELEELVAARLSTTSTTVRFFLSQCKSLLKTKASQSAGQKCRLVKKVTSQK